MARHPYDGMPRYCLVVWPEEPDHENAIGCIPISDLPHATKRGAKVFAREWMFDPVDVEDERPDD